MTYFEYDWKGFGDSGSGDVQAESREEADRKLDAVVAEARLNDPLFTAWLILSA